jgi:hypothetical protein
MPVKITVGPSPVPPVRYTPLSLLLKPGIYRPEDEPNDWRVVVYRKDQALYVDLQADQIEPYDPALWTGYFVRTGEKRVTLTFED